jgi:thiol-disulfide isomerase/thioredoxin
MNDQIVCPNCKKTIPLTQALSHELNEKYQEQLEEEKNKQ